MAERLDQWKTDLDQDGAALTPEAEATQGMSPYNVLRAESYCNCMNVQQVPKYLGNIQSSQ